MAHGKAPGSDGLPMEFFVKFWDVLGLDLVDVLNSCYFFRVPIFVTTSWYYFLGFQKGG